MNYERQSHGFRICSFDAVTSTSDEAGRLARDGAPDRTLVWARSQTVGRGRLGRPWHSPEGNLYTTAILDPGLPLARMQELSFVASLAVHDTVAQLLPAADLKLKWPNDVLLDGAKISGILTETQARDGGYIALLGVGINLAHAPEVARYRATALINHLVPPPTVEALLNLYVEALALRYDAWCSDGFGAIRDAWVARARWIGQTVSVENGADRKLGLYEGIDADGTMILRLGDGRLEKIAAGDVRLVEEN
ncbi:biotin--[acetyl-CoA-carboxylase] ligase [Nisaea acidiphila]|uniref:biotin--[biotin carboxyl-carrier protein] ligase n=1 Tax=Nisaea acidiphila TaxID=1862145 RepID=A0A9J7ARK6_9PROT|nr:biotin--[acetyl-CoA-carboxylase] ligase [Nisaea acidiphila]UUX50243.1 biotin--[acetyl-CoA-carboxylase] ligase [Nisaea acidiphila]